MTERSPERPVRRRRLARRVTQLSVGLCCFGLAGALQVRAGLGLDPWDVFHQGLGSRLHIKIGTAVILVGAALLLLWIPLRQKFGVGTLGNVVVAGAAMNAALALLPSLHGLPLRLGVLVGAIVLSGCASGLTVGARLGPGARDGLMTGLAARFGWSLRATRAGIEITVLVIGILMGGTVGLGTVLYAVAIGPLAQMFIRGLTVAGARGVVDDAREVDPSTGL